ncbi:MAG: gluconate transporter [Planctomycetes bacterium]|nr:gluconate transporter [Planctomycetota bacterium]
MIDSLLSTITDVLISSSDQVLAAADAAATTTPAASAPVSPGKPEVGPFRLISAIVIGITALLVLIIRFKMHPFITLLVVSMGVGIGSGLAPLETLKSVETGMGKALGFIAIVVGLGAMFGRMLEVSGGAERLARSIVRAFGEKNTQWAMTLTGFLISIPIFLDVGLVILIPIIYSLCKKAGKPLLYYGIPLLAGLAVSHSFIPPTPGPMTAAVMLQADLGWVILFGVIAGIPAAIIAGPLFGRYIADKVTCNIVFPVEGTEADDKDLPGFGMVLFLILLPLLMILIGTLIAIPAIGNYFTAVMFDRATIGDIIRFICHPFSALIIVSLVAFRLLGKFKGYTRDEVQEIATKSLEPVGIIILVTGAGGVFKSILSDTGIGTMIGDMMKTSAMSPLIAAFLIASFIRVAQGSATVAMVTTCGLMFPINEALGVGGRTLDLMVIAIAAGATVLSHVNDSGFWLVNRFFGMSVKDTLKSWTVSLTLVGLIGFAMVLLMSLFV